jgi:hypothetical protein
LKEGYLRISWPAAHLVIGRQAVTLGHSLILDDSADAVTVAIPMSWATLTFMDLFLVNTSSGTSATSGYLVDLNVDPTAGFKSSLFVLFIKDRGPNLVFNQTASFAPCAGASPPELSPAACPLTDFGNDQATVGTLGLSMDQQMSSIRWGAELDFLTGSIKTHDNTPTLNPGGNDISIAGMNALGQLGWTGTRYDTLFTGLFATGQKPGDLPPNGKKLNLNAISPNFVLGNILVNNETVSDRDGGNVGGLTDQTGLGLETRPHVPHRAGRDLGSSDGSTGQECVAESRLGVGPQRLLAVGTAPAPDRRGRDPVYREWLEDALRRSECKRQYGQILDETDLHFLKTEDEPMQDRPLIINNKGGKTYEIH